MTTIKQQDFIQSIADAFQFISFYQPVDFISAMGKADERGPREWQAKIWMIPVTVV